MRRRHRCTHQKAPSSCRVRRVTNSPACRRFQHIGRASRPTPHQEPQASTLVVTPFVGWTVDAANRGAAYSGVLSPEHDLRASARPLPPSLGRHLVNYRSEAAHCGLPPIFCARIPPGPGVRAASAGHRARVGGRRAAARRPGVRPDVHRHGRPGVSASSRAGGSPNGQSSAGEHVGRVGQHLGAAPVGPLHVDAHHIATGGPHRGCHSEHGAVQLVRCGGTAPHS